jgi:hypothetical protein
MFPCAFADKVIARYSRPGESVLDPFAGRGTSIFSAAAQGRPAIGVEINPVGWVYAKAKLRPAPSTAVQRRLLELARMSGHFATAAENLPPFFDHCFRPNVLRFLLAARASLAWRHNQADCTAMALLLVNLHGKRAASLSNQMRQTKAMSPRYAIRWWEARRMRPPDLDPVEFMRRKIEWRYAKGTPDVASSRVLLGDSTKVLPRIGNRGATRPRSAALLLTSPPYLGIANYHYDQWLRLWLLGGPPGPGRPRGAHRGKFENKEAYRKLLVTVFTSARRLLKPEASIYVRTDRRRPTLSITADALREAFPGRKLSYRSSPRTAPTQTALFGSEPRKGGEMDLVMT